MFDADCDVDVDDNDGQDFDDDNDSDLRDMRICKQATQTGQEDVCPTAGDGKIICTQERQLGCQR